MTELVFGRRYRVTEKIGTGGMADVYKAVDEVLGRTVAIKTLHPRYASDPGFVARFRQEAQSAANLSHPNIVNIYDWGRDDEAYYIVMEYVRGTDLKALVEEKGAIDPLKAAEYCSQVAAALSVAHGYDIIHRDIKPHNIVLMPEGTVKVMDFGIARAGNTTMTQTGSVLGTAQYVSPEQAQGRDLGPQSDLYSLGVVLYELTTGQTPFEGDSPVSVALKQVNEEPVPPSEINPDIPPALESVILRAMLKDPSERYTSAEEMRRDLQRAASGRMVETAPREGDTTVMPVVGRTNGSGSPRVRPIPQNRKTWPWVVVAILALLGVGFGAAYYFGLIGGPEKIVIPDVTDLTQEEATEALEAIELAVGDVEERFNENIEAGLVISQSPEPGVEVEVGAEVKLVISVGQELFSVPDLVGLSEGDAISTLREAGFDLDTIQREYNTEVDPDLVISHTPSAETSAPIGTKITLVVSRGAELKKVPSVVGEKEAAAKTTLEEAGFEVKTTEEFSESVDEGNVIRQSPQEGVSVATGSEITIVVSKGPDVVQVPGVIDMTEAEAINAIESAGLQVMVNYQTHTEDDIVLTQNPVPNTTVGRGTTVTIWIGRTPAPPAP